MDRLEFLEQTLIDLVEWRESLEESQVRLRGMITDSISRLNTIGKILAVNEDVTWQDYV
jgi:hypothetical protein